MQWNDWLTHFEANAGRRLPPILVGEEMPAPALLARSLAVFQRGETGEGRIAKDIWRTELAGIDDAYRTALGLFVAEEGRHARILASCIRSLGGKTLRGTWTDLLFVRARRLAGVRMKLMVLLVAEVVGICFYDLLAEALPKSSIRSALEQIVEDEKAHLEFHVDFFRTQLDTEAKRRLFTFGFRLVGQAARHTVVFDHRHTLRALGIPPAAASSLFDALLGDVLSRIDQRPQAEALRCAS